jgi:hypothetical protein
MSIPEHIVAQWHKQAMFGADEQGFGPNSCWGKFAALAIAWNELTKQATDNVNHPPHYTQTGIECIDAIKAALGADGFHAYCKGQVLKYLWRAEHKGNRIEDLRKAQWYMERLVVELI